MLLEIEYIDDFLNKCKRMLKEYPEEAEYLVDALYHIVHAVLFAGYIRGKDPDFDYNDALGDIFAKFSTDEWKEFNGAIIHEDEDYFRALESEAFDTAERLYPMIERLMATEPIKGPIGRVVFKVEEVEEEEEKEEKGDKDEG